MLAICDFLFMFLVCDLSSLQVVLQVTLNACYLCLQPLSKEVVKTFMLVLYSAVVRVVADVCFALCARSL